MLISSGSPFVVSFIHPLIFLSLISGHPITLLNPEPKKDDFWETKDQWKEPIYHLNWGLERCLLCSVDSQDAGSETKGLAGEYHIVWVRTGLQICIYNWHFPACPLILRKHDFILFKKHQKRIAFKTIFFFFFPKYGREKSPPPNKKNGKMR